MSEGAQQMSDRITPYEEGGDIKERIDEIVASGVDVHFEMTGPETACLWIGGDAFLIHTKADDDLICKQIVKSGVYTRHV
jgi:hypothetical protein